MPPKKRIPAPIDRPLSRAYLRGFKGWSTAYPPGQSDPATLRLLDNMLVDRNGSMAVRPGLRYLSFEESPDLDAAVPNDPGQALSLEPVGGQELFYTADGSRALLFGVRELDGTVGFRALLFSGQGRAVFELTAPEIGFIIPQGTDALNFTEGTKYIKYLQINNRILALSDNGEPARMFLVGAQKLAKRLNTISVPAWADEDKLTVIHPNAPWINEQATTTRTNTVQNPIFKAGTSGWAAGPGTWWRPRLITSLTNWKARINPAAGTNPTEVLEIQSLPYRTNILPSPLMNVALHGTQGWSPHPTWTPSAIVADTSWLSIRATKTSRFYAQSARSMQNIRGGARYRLALDIEVSGDLAPDALVWFYAVNGAEIDRPLRVPITVNDGRFISDAFKAPEGSVMVRVALGGEVEGAGQVNVRHAVLCLDGESTTAFSGASGTDYFWGGAENLSYSVQHPPADVEIRSNTGSVLAGKALFSRIEVIAAAARSIDAELRVITSSKDGASTTTLTSVAVDGTANVWTTLTHQRTPVQVPSTHVRGQLVLVLKDVRRGERALVTRAMQVTDQTTALTYFDGSTQDTPTTRFRWSDPLRPHRSSSIRQTFAAAPPAVVPETPTSRTLIATGGAANNTYKMGFFYTFENEVGESNPSRITEVRVSRPWSNWLWETANAAGEPSGTATKSANLAADQLLCRLPQEVYDQAIADGALKWNLYVMSWSDQDPVPVTGLLVAERQMRSSGQLAEEEILTYTDGGWIAVTPARTVSTDDMPLPTATNRTNYSIPPAHRSGMVAGERMVLVGDPANLAAIQWSSNRPAESTNFTATKGGGTKTLTSGNLNTPSDVVLWQNPQSQDTITLLCSGDDGQSVSYFMAPATVTQGQSGVTGVMGFEEVTSTPGTTGPYAALVANNALMRPTDLAYLQSRAQNYNITHKDLSEDIANVWRGLREKQWIVSAMLDNRIFMLVYNAQGELLRQGCRGNEIWVRDIATEGGTWSRMTVQAHSLHVFTIGTRPHLGVTTPEGIFYFDRAARVDDYVAQDGTVQQRPIPWMMETNTQGANRAHDAWANLQQVALNIGNFTGSLEYGIRGQNVHGKTVEITKVFTDNLPYDLTDTWDVEDFLLIRHHMKEWFFYARSIPGVASSGEICTVQYRYTPASVNAGYEFGSVETFDYGSNVTDGPDGYSTNGIPVPFQDFSRP